MEVVFHSAPCLSKSLLAVGFEMDVAQLSQGRLMGGGQEDLVEVAALEELSPHQLQGIPSGELGVGAGLMKDLVAWGFKNTGQPIKLNDLSAMIFASRSSIVHHCRQSFGTGPMALLKQIRLSQVCLLYTSPSPRDRSLSRMPSSA